MKKGKNVESIRTAGETVSPLYLKDRAGSRQWNSRCVWGNHPPSITANHAATENIISFKSIKLGV